MWAQLYGIIAKIVHKTTSCDPKMTLEKKFKKKNEKNIA